MSTPKTAANGRLANGHPQNMSLDNGRFPPHVLLVTTPRTYRTQAFLDAAAKLGITVTQALDLPPELAEEWQVPLGVDFRDVENAVEAITSYAQNKPLTAILAVDDSGTMLAAHASAKLGLPHNDVASAEAARDKHKMRQMLAQGNVASPHFQRFSTADDPHTVTQQVNYPCVVKPTTLSGSRGVIRANTPEELVAAIQRLTAMLDTAQPSPYLVEDYLPGVEVALEGMLENGRLTILALFDKPDPLEGPFFEETIYVTPSRLPKQAQEAIATTTAQAAQALGLRTGPIHAELRVNDAGSWIVEIAGRSIGGLCSNILQFSLSTAQTDANASLEELILRQACGLPILSTKRADQAGGVMMIPIPKAGLLRSIDGLAVAEAVPLIDSIEITAKLNYPLVPLPEGESYLGFIFARGTTPAAIEAALREAHNKLTFEIAPLIQLAIT
ncbi:MAG: ATP-grasp domain-containing protein [Chloroflexota bacterium]